MSNYFSTPCSSSAHIYAISLVLFQVVRGSFCGHLRLDFLLRNPLAKQITTSRVFIPVLPSPLSAMSRQHAAALQRVNRHDMTHCVARFVVIFERYRKSNPRPYVGIAPLLLPGGLNADILETLFGNSAI
jgi:hypothetical protein